MSLLIALVAMGATVGMALAANGKPLGSGARLFPCVAPSAVDMGCERDARRRTAPDGAPDAPPSDRTPLQAIPPASQPAPSSSISPAASPPPSILTVSQDHSASAGTGGTPSSGGGTGNVTGGADGGNGAGSGGNGNGTGSNVTPGLSSSANGPLFSLPNLGAGRRVRRCISVMYVGAAPAHVRLYAAIAGTGLDRYLNVVVARGRMPTATSGSCTGFRPDTVEYAGAGPGVLYRGPLSSFPTSTTTPTLPASRLWRSGESHTYRIAVSIVSAQAAQGLSTSFDFVWRARS